MKTEKVCSCGRYITIVASILIQRSLVYRIVLVCGAKMKVYLVRDKIRKQCIIVLLRCTPLPLLGPACRQMAMFGGGYKDKKFLNILNIYNVGIPLRTDHIDLPSVSG